MVLKFWTLEDMLNNNHGEVKEIVYQNDKGYEDMKYRIHGFNPSHKETRYSFIVPKISCFNESNVLFIEDCIELSPGISNNGIIGYDYANKIGFVNEDPDGEPEIFYFPNELITFDIEGTPIIGIKPDPHNKNSVIITYISEEY